MPPDKNQTAQRSVHGCGTLTSRAHAREEGGCETVRKPEGLEKTQGRGACTFAKGNALSGKKLNKPS
jgi:hypothetical protein